MKKVNNKYKIKIDVILFYICYIIMIASVMFQRVNNVNSMLSSLYNISLIILFILFLFNIKKYSKKNIILLLIALCWTIYLMIRFNNNILFKIILFSVACKNIDFDKLVKLDIVIKTIFIIMVSSLYFAGYTDTGKFYREGIIRYSMGFSNPNVFSTYIMSIVAELLYLRRDRLNFYYIIPIILACLIINYYANSRTQIICILLLAFALYINKYFKGELLNKKIVKSIFKNSFLIFGLISFILTYLYIQNNSFVVEINTLSNGRFSTPAEIINSFGLSIFGMDIKNEGITYSLDNVYTYSLISLGVFSFIIMSIFSYKLMNYLYSKKYYSIIIILLILFLGGFMERFSIRLHYNIFLLIFNDYIFSYLKNRKQEGGEV